VGGRHTVGTMALPPVGDLLAGMHVVAIPMRVRFRGVSTREVALFEGPHGWGEFGAFLEYGTDEASRWLASAIETAYEPWPDAVRAAVPVNATVPAVTAEQVAAVISRFPGCTTAKVKVAEPGHSRADDVARVAEVRAVMGPTGRVRIDANGAWSVDDAVDALRLLAPYGLEYAEQPCATVEELRDVRIALARSGVDVPIAADESIRRAEDPLRVRDLEAADIVVVKVAPLGGVRAALRVVQECGLPAVVSSALDTSVGISSGVALAAALPSLDHACGLGTVALLEGDVTLDPLLPHDGALATGRVAADRGLLDRWAATPDRRAWWAHRVVDCHAALTETRRSRP
jgi:o-succinylbenzoate synthase